MASEADERIAEHDHMACAACGMAPPKHDVSINYARPMMRRVCARCFKLPIGELETRVNARDASLGFFVDRGGRDG